MQTTLVDFYLNVAALAGVVYLRERSAAVACAWVLALACLGSMMT
jgi:hypothetical protein